VIDFLKNRKVQIAAQAVVITGLVGGTGAVVTMNKPVTLEVNGQAEEIRTFGGTVGDILDSHEIDVDKRDQVKPGVGTKVDRDMTITVNTAKKVALSVDGKETNEWTNANTVGQALADLGVDAKGADLNAKASQRLKEEGNDIDVTTSKDLTVVADGKDHKVSAAVGTAKEALKDTGVKLDKDDFLSVPMSAEVSDGQVLTVNRVKNDTVKDKQAIKAKVETKKSDSLYEGETKVETEGKDGEKQVTYKVKTINGEEVKKEKKDEKVLSEPKTKVVIQGTKKKEEPADTGGSDSGDSGDSGSNDSGDSGDSTGGDSRHRLRWRRRRLRWRRHEHRRDQGHARWTRIQVVPGRQVRVELQPPCGEPVEPRALRPVPVQAPDLAEHGRQRQPDRCQPEGTVRARQEAPGRSRLGSVGLRLI
jgi:uncharacterized protein YabE (DUF348 family)